MKPLEKKLSLLAKRLAELSGEISNLNRQREVNLYHCNKTNDEDFEMSREGDESCLITAYRWVKEDLDSTNGGLYREFSGFEEVIHMYGCANCKGAHMLKKEIGTLKKSKAGITTAIIKIGQKL